MLDRIEIAVWIVWTVWLYSVSGAVTVTMYRPPLVWNPQLGEFVVARDFEQNTAASSVRMHPNIGPIGQAGFREPFYQLPQFKYYPYSPYRFDRLPIGRYIGEEELLQYNDYDSKSEEVPNLTEHPVEILEDDSELSSLEIDPPYQFVSAPQAWATNILSTNMKVVDKNPTRKYLPPMTTDGPSTDKKTRDKRAIHPMFLRRKLLTGDGIMNAPKDKNEKTKVTEQTPETTTIQSHTNPFQQSHTILPEKISNAQGKEEPPKRNSKISRVFGITEDGELPNPRAYPEIKNKFARKFSYTPVLESTRPKFNKITYEEHGDTQTLPEVRSATPETFKSSKRELYKKNFLKMVQTNHAMYPKKIQQHAEQQEILRGSKIIPLKDNRIKKSPKVEDSINNLELSNVHPNEKYSEYNRVPKTSRKTRKNVNGKKLTTMDPDVKDSDYNKVSKDNDKKMQSNFNDIELSTISASIPTSTTTSTTSTTTTARPGFVLSANPPSLNSYRYNTFQPPPVMSAYGPDRPVGYTAYEHKPIPAPIGFAANIVRWIVQSVPIPIHL